jgi:hypothetical protein
MIFPIFHCYEFVTTQRIIYMLMVLFVISTSATPVGKMRPERQSKAINGAIVEKY